MKRKLEHFLTGVLASVSLVSFVLGDASAQQNYPSKPIKLINDSWWRTASAAPNW